MNILVIDVGGTHVKILATGETEKREIDSGPTLTAQQMVSSVKKLADDWKYDAVSIGYPGPVVHDRPIAEPHNLGQGWMGFNFAAAFKLPGESHQRCRDAGPRQLQGRQDAVSRPGTGLGSTMIVDGIVEPMELGIFLTRKTTYEDYVGARALDECGKKDWRKHVEDVVETSDCRART